jgi:hypothetical protein
MLHLFLSANEVHAPAHVFFSAVAPRKKKREVSCYGDALAVWLALLRVVEMAVDEFAPPIWISSPDGTQLKLLHQAAAGAKEHVRLLGGLALSARSR